MSAERVVLRDPISVQYVKKLVPERNVEQALDSAFQHDPDSAKCDQIFNEYEQLKTFIKNHEKCIGITITDLKWHPVHSKEAVIKKIPKVFQSFVDKRISEGYGIVYIPQLYGDADDTSLMREFMRDEHTFIIDSKLEQHDSYFQQYVIGKMYAVVGMRYHSNIFSAKMGTPFVSVSYEQKMKGFMQYVGLDQYCIDLHDLTTEKLESVFSELEKGHDMYKQKLDDMHDKLKSEAKKTTQVVVEMLENRQ